MRGAAATQLLRVGKARRLDRHQSALEPAAPFLAARPGARGPSRVPLHDQPSMDAGPVARPAVCGLWAERDRDVRYSKKLSTHGLPTRRRPPEPRLGRASDTHGLESASAWRRRLCKSHETAPDPFNLRPGCRLDRTAQNQRMVG